MVDTVYRHSRFDNGEYHAMVYEDLNEFGCSVCNGEYLEIKFGKVRFHLYYFNNKRICNFTPTTFPSEPEDQLLFVLKHGGAFLPSHINRFPK